MLKRRSPSPVGRSIFLDVDDGFPKPRAYKILPGFKNPGTSVWKTTLIKHLLLDFRAPGTINSRPRMETGCHIGEG